MAEEIRFKKSERACDKLIYLGYMYTRLRENKNGVVWRCDMRGGCNATVTLSEDGSSVVKEPSEHKNHSADWGRIKAKECLENMKARAGTSENQRLSLFKMSYSVLQAKPMVDHLQVIALFEWLYYIVKRTTKKDKKGEEEEKAEVKMKEKENKKD
ncbi:hypothetical protein ANN_13779 [Periplaneta americana]|uniref:FLYWCH-type domain-containing protein n=1 Tax=Periplaneta americana TaxID=6978 RepID=A0ABQ8SVP3_PERAM|nr:hypothetical protein ANN_13779 [Periplaneta americana]